MNERLTPVDPGNPRKKNAAALIMRLLTWYFHAFQGAWHEREPEMIQAFTIVATVIFVFLPVVLFNVTTGPWWHAALVGLLVYLFFGAIYIALERYRQ
jgi:glucan phosphoethanolaminetransferase (alkaline phosphatase superfamily)